MFQRVKNLAKKASAKIIGFAVASVTLIGSAFAAAPTPPASITDEQVGEFMTNVTNQFSITQIVTILGIIVSFAVVYAFAWWAIRKVIRGGMSAVKRGKVRV